MKKRHKTPEEISAEIDQIHKEIQPALYEYDQNNAGNNKIAQNELNLKILKITMTIKDKYPELSQFLNEMSATIPDDKDPRITLKNLSAYYNSLSAMLGKYILEHPEKNI